MATAGFGLCSLKYRPPWAALSRGRRSAWTPQNADRSCPRGIGTTCPEAWPRPGPEAAALLGRPHAARPGRRAGPWCLMDGVPLPPRAGQNRQGTRQVPSSSSRHNWWASRRDMKAGARLCAPRAREYAPRKGRGHSRSSEVEAEHTRVGMRGGSCHEKPGQSN